MQYLTPFTVGDNIVNIIKDIDTPSLSNEECNPSTNEGTTDAALKPIVDVDVGCLCIPNSSSTLGGLCASDNTISVIKKTTRHLQKDLDTAEVVAEPEPLPFTTGICPATCDQALCTCAASTEEGFPDAQDCATELNAVCESGGTKDCFDAEVLPFYDNTYCTFSKCWLDSGSYEDCSCQYYEDYCTLYEAYATNAYPDVVEKCDIADCCKKAKESEDQQDCMPKIFELKPSVAPSVLTVTEEPTVPPVTPEVMTSPPTVQVTTLAPVEDTPQVTTMPPAVIQEVEDAAAEDVDTDVNDTESDIPEEEPTGDSDAADNTAPGESSAATGVDESNESNSAVSTFGCVGAAAVVGCAFLLM